MEVARFSEEVVLLARTEQIHLSPPPHLVACSSKKLGCLEGGGCILWQHKTVIVAE